MVLGRLCFWIVNRAEDYRIAKMRQKHHIDPSVELGNVRIMGNITIGKGTYINSGILKTGDESRITIGENCAIGYNVSIFAVTHDIRFPIHGKPIQKDITIGNHCWIGNNVFIDAGVKIGDRCIIGANAVVISDIPDDCVAGGVPAKLLYRRP